MRPWNLTYDLEKTIGHIFCASSSFVHHFIEVCEFKLEVQSGNTQFWSKSAIFAPCDLETWRMTMENNRATPLCHFKLCAAFHSHWSYQTGITVRKCPIWVKFGDFFYLCDLDLWPLTLTFLHGSPVMVSPPPKMQKMFPINNIIQASITFWDLVYSGVLKWYLPEAIPIPADVIVQQTRLINTSLIYLTPEVTTEFPMQQAAFQPIVSYSPKLIFTVNSLLCCASF